MRREDILTMKAIAICFKPYLKPHEAMIYCGLEHTAFAERSKAFGVYKNESGYFKRADLDLMMSGTIDRLPLPSWGETGIVRAKDENVKK
jgi:hypothetical protein